MARASAPAFGWWGEQWVQYITTNAEMEPLTTSQIRGAERGEARIEVERGRVSAVVGVGYGSSNTAQLRVKPMTERDWKRVVEQIALSPEAAQRLLSGTPGPELRAVFLAAGVEIFPESPTIRCTCWEHWGCRHRRVLAVRGAALFDANPFLWLQVVGRRREDLLAAVRARLADQAGRATDSDEASPIRADQFLTTPTDPATIDVRPGSTATPDALLRLLGPLPLPPDQGRLDQELAAYVEQISETATGLTMGELTPAFIEEPLPGKRLPLKARLLPELLAALEGAETPLHLLELHAASPTAMALPIHAAEQALRAAMADLPPEFVTLAGEWVAERRTVLAGLAFRHVVSLQECLQGALDLKSDWTAALRLAGSEPPYRVQVGANRFVAGPALFQTLAPEVGDELTLTVVNPDGPLLAAALRRRAERPVDVLDDGTAEAAAAVVRNLDRQPGRKLTESEALQLLLAEGYCRPERPVDEVWLLPFAIRSGELYWATGGGLTVDLWRRETPLVQRRWWGEWRERQNYFAQFGAWLVAAGRTRKDTVTALTCVELWCRQWTGDQTEPGRLPLLGVFAHWLWNVAPLEAGRLRGQPTETIPAVLGAWFRFLAERNPDGASQYLQLVAVCQMNAAFLHRVETLPTGRGVRERMEAWLLEGCRWLGRDLALGK